MTLDPVHLDGIAALAKRIRQDVDEDDHRDLAVEAWAEFLDPLYDGGAAVLEPIGDLARYAAPMQELALQDDPFDVVHGLDSGTMNPRTFRNGLVLDVAQAAMSASPSDLDLHRSRTTVVSVHSNDATVDYGESDDWGYHDERYVRQRIIKAPPVDRYEKVVVHALSLYLAESEHASRHADDVPEFLLLDGPIYPKGILQWAERGTVLQDLLAENDLVQEVLANYVDLVETFVERGVPLAGFVKNTSSRALTNLLGRKTYAPWANDVAFFTRILERRDEDGERETGELTWTNWFVSRLGADAVFADGDGLGLDLDLELDPAAYEVCFCVVYDPRTDLGFKIELPAAFARDDEVRAAVEAHVLAEVAAERGPPLAVGKADDLAHIGRTENESLVRRLEAEFDTRRQRDYDDVRWEEME